MIELDKILKIIDAVSESNLTEFDYDGEDGSLTLNKKQDQLIVQPDGSPVVTVPVMPQMPSPMMAAAPMMQQAATPMAAPVADAVTAGNAQLTAQSAPETAQPEYTGEEVKSPLVGTFYSAPSPDDAPYVKVGDTVKKGQTLGIVEAMKLMNEIESEYDGVVQAILVENEEIVEYGQPLFVIG